jgi:hypothetical protein
VHVALDASSFNAYTTGGDEYTASRQWLDAGPYPWVAHEAAALDPGATGGSADDVLTVSEIAIRVPLAIQRLEFSDGGVRVTALATVDRFAFGVTGRRGTMSRRLPVRVQLMAHRR